MEPAGAAGDAIETVAIRVQHRRKPAGQKFLNTQSVSAAHAQ